MTLLDGVVKCLPTFDLVDIYLRPDNRYLQVTFTIMTMADTENDPTVLGKRVREGEDASNIPGAGDSMQEDDDDDDVGPMPMPASGGTKKKRKGMVRILSWFVWT